MTWTLEDVRDEQLAGEALMEAVDTMVGEGNADHATLIDYANRARRHWERSRKMVEVIMGEVAEAIEAITPEPNRVPCVGGPFDGKELTAIVPGARVWSVKHEGKYSLDYSTPGKSPAFPEGSVVEGYYEAATDLSRAVWMPIAPIADGSRVC